MSFIKGDTVARRSIASEVGVIVEGPISRRGQTWYTVFFGGRRENVLEVDLQPVSEAGTIRGLFLEGVFGDERSFSRLLTLARINEPIRDTIYSYQASRTELHGYQFKPLLKYLSSPFRRILIADEVGLGKTIEAAYIFQEERARHDLQRVMIICPASLRIKWQNELYQRFGERFELLDAAGVRRRLASSARRDELEQRLFAIVSYETVRSSRVRALLDESPPSIDLLIADEIHHCRNRDTHNFRAVRTLAENSDSVVFLSATPVHTGNDNLFNLMNLLLPERFEVDDAFQRQLSANRHVVRAESYLCAGTAEGIAQARAELELLARDEIGRRVTEDPFYAIIMESLESPELVGNTERLVEIQEMLAGLNLLGDVLTRTRKRDVEEGSAIRVAYSHTPRLGPYEQSAYENISAFIFKQYQKRYDSAIARFVLSGLQRQIASSLYAAVSYYRECFDLVDDEQVSSSLDIEESDFVLDSETDDDAQEYSLKRDPHFRDIIMAIPVKQLLSEDTKYQALSEVLRNSGKAIIFAFYKRSLRYLEDRLGAEGIATVRIDGDVPSSPESPDEDERIRRIRHFRDDPACKALLSSQVGSEGLDFQFCNTIINWDLPWNPMVVEQRIGRIDRLGQKSERVFIHNLVSKGTIEELILSRLYQRIGVFNDSIGELEPILGPVITRITRDLFSPRLTQEEKEQRIIRGAQAVERERAYMQTLETNSAQLIGHDEIIRQKIDKIKHLGRFLTGKELEIFVGEFLARRFPASRLCNEGGKEGRPGDGQARWLHVTPKLRQFIVERVGRTDLEGQRLAQLLRRDELKCVFEANAAMQHPDAELMHSHHSLVKLIAAYYGTQPHEMHRVNVLRLHTESVTPGQYFYGWASIDERGAFNSRHLLLRLLSVSDGEPVSDPETCERLLYEMVIDGLPWAMEHPIAGRDVLEGLYDWFEDTAAEYAERYRAKRNKAAEAVVLRQLQALEASIKVKRERREKAIATARAAGRSETIIRLQKDQIKKIEADFSLRSAELEALKTVDVSYRVDGVGWLWVLPTN